MHSSQRPCFKTTLAFNVAWRNDVALQKHWSEQTSKTSSEFFRALSSILDLWDWGEFLGLVGEVRSLDADDGLILCPMCGTFEFFCKQQQGVWNPEMKKSMILQKVNVSHIWDQLTCLQNKPLWKLKLVSEHQISDISLHWLLKLFTKVTYHKVIPFDHISACLKFVQELCAHAHWKDNSIQLL